MAIAQEDAVERARHYGAKARDALELFPGGSSNREDYAEITRRDYGRDYGKDYGDSAFYCRNTES
ncbi:MAG: hypothetical protein ACLQIQ_01315 [Beijerinckiaceae bacterium]